MGWPVREGSSMRGVMWWVIGVPLPMLLLFYLFGLMR
jgi:hypothetical protein